MQTAKRGSSPTTLTDMAYSVESGFDECYEGTSVLVNKLDIRDEATLAEVESIVTTTKISMLLGERYEGDFTAAHYCDIHRFIFEDLYDWAGCVRKVELSKKSTHFHAPDGLERDLGLLFEYLNSQGCFMDDGREQFAEHLAEFYNDINLLHPFREGNGRAQRVLVTQIAQRAGHVIDFSLVDKDRMMIATIYAAQGVLDQLKELFMWLFDK